METRGRLPSPKPGRNQHVSTEARLRCSAQKQTIRKSTNRSETEMQTTQPLHASWSAKIQMELRDKALNDTLLSEANMPAHRSVRTRFAAASSPALQKSNTEYL